MTKVEKPWGGRNILDGEALQFVTEQIQSLLRDESTAIGRSGITHSGTHRDQKVLPNRTLFFLSNVTDIRAVFFNEVKDHLGTGFSLISERTVGSHGRNGNHGPVMTHRIEYYDEDGGSSSLSDIFNRSGQIKAFVGLLCFFWYMMIAANSPASSTARHIVVLSLLPFWMHILNIAMSLSWMRTVVAPITQRRKALLSNEMYHALSWATTASIYFLYLIVLNWKEASFFGFLYRALGQQ